MTQAKLHSHAKLNLSLLVYKPQKNNYHPLRSIFQTINLYDTLIIQPQTEKSLNISCDNKLVPTDQKNILYKVFQQLENIPHGFKIHIEKKIPMGGGLGGGSSNAAAFIKYLEIYYPASIKKLSAKKISLKIGADVPFFLTGKTALVGGIGEKITTIETKIKNDFALILPNIHSDTKQIYQDYDKNISHLKKSGKTPQWMLDTHVGHNDLKKVVFELNPILNSFENELKKENIALFMSGSGSTLFIPNTNDNINKKIKTIIKNGYPGFNLVSAKAIDTEAIKLVTV